MKNDQELKEVTVYKENGSYYMKLIYEYETTSGFYRRTYPKVIFPVTLLSLPRTLNNDLAAWVFVDELIKPKVHEMTLEEIEKKLGYSVKIVSK